MKESRLREIIKEEIIGFNEGVREKLRQKMIDSGHYNKEFEEYLKKAPLGMIKKRLAFFGTSKIENIVKESAKDYKKSGEYFIAQNESGWHWEYDYHDVYAYLYVNVKTKKLRLVIEKVDRKTGLGAGEWKKNETFDVGTVDKPLLAKIRSILKDRGSTRSRAGWPFSVKWKNADGKEDSLGNILKGYK